MKRLTLSLIITLAAFGNVEAQEKIYNKWSFDINGGLTKPTRPMTPGYTSETFDSFYHVDAGVRYMANTKFGVKADFGYDNMKNAKNTNKFETNYYRVSLQGVANLGRIMNFEDWTRVLNLQAHAGAGYSWMTSDGFTGKNNMANLIAGLTAQVKLGNRVALNADFSVIQNAGQNYTFDGRTSGVEESRGFEGTLYNATLGFSFYLGGAKQHADWYVGDKLTNRLDELENRLNSIEKDLIDSDNDGVADYLDLEPNTPAGNIVNVKGISIDLNQNGIPDSYEVYFAEVYGKNTPMTASDLNTAKDLINDGYIAMYFDFNKSQPKNTEALSFVLNYLKANPSASVEVNGYADSVGSSNYNTTLSDKRAKSVAKMLEESGISSSRIKVVGKGIDNSLNGKNKVASQFARKVTFKVN
nr:OmpA family protein [uncultured Flavobacterium sp.]